MIEKTRNTSLLGVNKMGTTIQTQCSIIVSVQIVTVTNLTRVQL